MTIQDLESAHRLDLTLRGLLWSRAKSPQCADRLAEKEIQGLPRSQQAKYMPGIWLFYYISHIPEGCLQRHNAARTLNTGTAIRLVMSSSKSLLGITVFTVLFDGVLL